MNPEVKRKWIEALRSGEYKQGRDGLKRVTLDYGTQYCCLGVLCEIYRVEVKRVKWMPIDDDSSGWLRIMKEESVLPPKVKEWAGMDDANGEFSRKRGPADSLTSLNDRGKSFKQIAKIIERYF